MGSTELERKRALFFSPAGPYITCSFIRISSLSRNETVFCALGWLIFGLRQFAVFCFSLCLHMWLWSCDESHLCFLCIKMALLHHVTAADNRVSPQPLILVWNAFQTYTTGWLPAPYLPSFLAQFLFGDFNTYHGSGLLTPGFAQSITASVWETQWLHSLVSWSWRIHLKYQIVF